MQSPSPLSATSTAACRGGECGEIDCGIDDVGDARDEREVWADQRRTLHPRREESITQGVQRLRVGEHEDDGDAPAVGPNDQEWNNEDDEGGEEEAGHVPPFKQSSMGGRGGKTRVCGRNGRWRKIAVGKGSDAKADADTEGHQFWFVDDMIALIRAKRDQDAHLQGMGTAFARMKPREWKWLDVGQRLKKGTTTGRREVLLRRRGALPFRQEEEHEAANFRSADGMHGEARGSSGVDDGEQQQAAVLHPNLAV
ncbi:hypothetical protein CBR_g36521 [Chara braunii]|uniref:Uncharacterized protein n=1 Tax=Chara braunii TaxID=69332 RepID=A0A388LLA3_CHABU|nr:hypothetical protein CBR_g36521 [Chara braunii]|eukprot:GBG82992.1 hypothetical protein CBR_g36521 [Chara braunii]